MASLPRLILFTRYPQPGTTKTRLIPALGPEGAAALQRQMTEHTLKQVRQLMAQSLTAVEIWFAGSSADTESDRLQMQQWLGAGWDYCAQGTGDLGSRMAQAFEAAFAKGADRVVIIGTDCPQLDADRLSEALQQLQSHDLVLGEATDGGYYLIGLRRFVPELFVGIDWSTERVLQQSLAIAEQQKLAVGLLAPLTDIDRPEDLPIWAAVQQATVQQATLQQAALQQPKLSVIIPVLNEAAAIEKVLPSVLQDGVEVIVVDGGSQDGTLGAVARAAGAKVINSPVGRAKQMNAGAAIATAETLLFLHADTRLPDDFLEWVEQTLAQPKTIAGAFELGIEGDQVGLRWVEWGVKWRSRLLQMPYGDQALFLKANIFRALGGFTELPIMEDFEFVRRLRSLGKVAIVPAAVLTSGRRWHKLGVLQTTLTNQLVIAAYFLGVPPETIERWYSATRLR
ncbi:TIGR04283 family arsenosugar biosynthesis glycosyltransferase [Phormidium tenue FACHB-886]|nr:TIGR04283 family arsenosugar biosynthesis glycosyltransferase [Phormidium tenue FACHB-886]